MDLTEFNNLSEEERAALLKSLETNETKVNELEAERDSLKEELNEHITNTNEIKKELKETKKVNYTLARQIEITPDKSPEEYLKEIFGGD